MSTNQGPEYFAAEKRYQQAQTIDDQIFWLEEMIKNFKKHKGSENMLSNIKQRLAKLIEKKEKGKKTGKTTKKAIRKEGFQCVLVGLTNSGKSSLLSKLTNAKPLITPYNFTTTYPELGTMDYTGVKAQIVDLPAIGSENFDVGIINTADCIIIVISDLTELEKIKQVLHRATEKRIIAFNKVDEKSVEELRKLEATLRSKKLEAVLISTVTGAGIDELKERIFSKMNVIRIYTKEPGKQPSYIPMVLKKDSTVKDAAESILKGFSKRVKQTKITGPSSKFANQKVGLSHVLKDRDIVEFQTN